MSESAGEYSQLFRARTSAQIIDRIAVDLKFYREAHSDLGGISSDNELMSQYAQHGYFEGRVAHPLATRERFLSTMSSGRTLEIGPFCFPALTGSHVQYADTLNTNS